MGTNKSKEVKIMKKNGMKILIIIFAIFLMTTPVMAQKEISIIVDGKKIETDVPPYIENGRTMVPARFVTEVLGGTAGHFEDGDFPIPVIVINHPDQPLALSMFDGKKIALMSQGAFRTDVPPRIVNGRTMIPVRFITDYLGYDIYWEEDTWTIHIDTTKRIYDEDFAQRYYDEKASKALEDLLIKGDFSKESFEKALR